MNVEDYKKSLEIKNKKPNKMRNTVCYVDGIKFQSTKEGDYYKTLKFRKQANQIKDFKWQVKYEFIFTYSNEMNTNSYKQIIKYFADFVVENNDGTIEVIDVKAFDKRSGKFRTTPEFNKKKKLMKKLYNIDIKIV